MFLLIFNLYNLYNYIITYTGYMILIIINYYLFKNANSSFSKNIFYKVQTCKIILYLYYEINLIHYNRLLYTLVITL